jgi:hypothetical protein
MNLGFANVKSYLRTLFNRAVLNIDIDSVLEVSTINSKFEIAKPYSKHPSFHQKVYYKVAPVGTVENHTRKH